MQMEMGLVQTLLSHLLQLDIVLRRPTSTAEATSVTAGISFHTFCKIHLKVGKQTVATRIDNSYLV